MKPKFQLVLKVGQHFESLRKLSPIPIKKGFQVHNQYMTILTIIHKFYDAKHIIQFMALICNMRVWAQNEAKPSFQVICRKNWQKGAKVDRWKISLKT